MELVPDDQTDVQSKSRRSRWQLARIPIGGLVLIAIWIEFAAARNDVDHAADLEASAIQIVQVWTPHLFYMMMIIGVGIALYIITRVAE